MDKNQMNEEYTIDMNSSLADRIRKNLQDNNLMHFAEVFQNSNYIVLIQDKDKHVILSDQYCVNPKCNCNEVFISFIEIDENKNKSAENLTICYDFKKHSYRIEGSYTGSEVIDRYLAEFKEVESLIIQKYEKHYSKMKEVSRQVINMGTIVRSGIKVGRNNPCQCGSGRKYKQCCGKV